MKLSQVILLRAGWTPERLGIEEQIERIAPAALSISAVIDRKSGRGYLTDEDRARWAWKSKNMDPNGKSRSVFAVGVLDRAHSA